MAEIFLKFQKWIVLGWGLFLLMIAYFTGSSFLESRAFAQNKLGDWEEIEAVVLSSEISDVSNDLRTEKDEDGDIERRYRAYTVTYDYEAEFEAWGDIFTFEDYARNSGEMGVDDEIPESAYIIPEEGDTITVIFDPYEAGSYKVGSIEHWASMGKISLTNIIIPIVTTVLGIALTCGSAVSILRGLSLKGGKTVVENRHNRGGSDETH